LTTGQGNNFFNFHRRVAKGAEGDYFLFAFLSKAMKRKVLSAFCGSAVKKYL
jgi:hypothetical protein